MHPESSWSAFEPLDSERAATTHEQACWRKTTLEFCLSIHFDAMHLHALLLHGCASKPDWRVSVGVEHAPPCHKQSLNCQIVVWVGIPWRSVMARWAKETHTSPSTLISWLVCAVEFLKANKGPQQGETVVFSCWCLNTLGHWTLTATCLGLGYQLSSWTSNHRNTSHFGISN